LEDGVTQCDEGCICGAGGSKRELIREV